MSDAIIYTVDDVEYGFLRDIIIEDENEAEVARAVMDGHAHYDHEYDVAVVALEGARGMNTVTGIREHFRDTRIIWITSDKDFALVAIREHIYDFIIRPYDKEELRESVRRLLNENPNRHRYCMDNRKSL